MTQATDFPSRYQPLNKLGSGGGGEVWAVRDRPSSHQYALKILSKGATSGEMEALVREVAALSGLEGLGFPRVLQFGRLLDSRPYMVRELVQGRSLLEIITEGRDLPGALKALLGAAQQLTRVHRAGFFHGDIKPANIIVEPSGRATLVDLGLAAPWQEGGSGVRGLTPRYAAPELMQGGSLTPRAEVYALGAALEEITQSFDVDAEIAADLAKTVRRATHEDPSQRHPSADEFASDLQRAARLSVDVQTDDHALVWPIVELEPTSARLMQRVAAMQPCTALCITGDPGSGRSVLLRRLCWALGVNSVPLSWVDASALSASVHRDSAHSKFSIKDFLTQELAEHIDVNGVRILVDNAEQLDTASVELLLEAKRKGACLIVVGEGPLCKGAGVFEVPPLGEFAAVELLRRAVPSLTAAVSKRLIEHASGRPGQMRRLVELIAMNPVVREEDVDELISGLDELGQKAPSEPLERAQYFLEHGRYNAANSALAQASKSSQATIVQARIAVGLGQGASAIQLLEGLRDGAASFPPDVRRAWHLWYGRALIAVDEYSRALEVLSQVTGEDDAVGVEATAYEAFAQSYLGKSEPAIEQLERAVSVAERLGLTRTMAVSLACLGVVRQRREEGPLALAAYRRAIAAASEANDASTLGTVQLNLAGLLKVGGEIAEAVELYTAAADMGRRSGRLSTVRNALLNLANTDLYLGRVARARFTIETLEAQSAQLSPFQRAQLLGHQAALLLQEEALEQAAVQFNRCAAAYEALGRSLDAAEALLEGVLSAGRQGGTLAFSLAEQVARAKALLAESTLHGPLLLLATARVQTAAGDEAAARESINAAISAARSVGERDWVWRSLAARAELEAGGGQPIMARRDREEALAVLEEIAARLPRDLREVFWNDPRRRQLRELVEQNLGHASTHLFSPRVHSLVAHGSGLSAISSISSTPLEQRLTRILEINHELLADFDLETLTARVMEHAVDLLGAERGIVILRDQDGQLQVHTSRARSKDPQRTEFSRSIAQQVMATRTAVVTLNARQDARLNAFESVHQLMLEAVACVPIPARSGVPLGALYLEARQRPGRVFEQEIPMLQAFADQVGLALETARLVLDNRNKAEELGKTNDQLRTAEQHLRELLGERTEKLKLARRRLRDVRETLNARFGYHGMVGTSEAMRRVYSLIDRLKDTDVPLLITGESGTGKEVAARAIHRASPRHKQPLLAINCGAIPEHLLESELFGHVRGAFTGADRERKGLIREAEGGAVLLDEIGEMPHKMQAGLLRVLQERMVRPVGGAKEEPVDVRFIFATHRNLEQLVAEGKFREDLYYRIHVVEVHMPSLAERRDDIPALVDHFLGIFAARYRRDRKSLSRESLRVLMAYDWPGNVRQLEHVLLNGWILSDSDEIEPADLELPNQARGSSAPRSSSGHAVPASGAAPARENPAGQAVPTHRNEEREKILEALRACSWNRVKAAEFSGIPRRTFYRRLREYKIQ